MKFILAFSLSTNDYWPGHQLYWPGHHLYWLGQPLQLSMS